MRYRLHDLDRARSRSQPKHREHERVGRRHCHDHRVKGTHNGDNSKSDNGPDMDGEAVIFRAPIGLRGRTHELKVRLNRSEQNLPRRSDSRRSCRCHSARRGVLPASRRNVVTAMTAAAQTATATNTFRNCMLLPPGIFLRREPQGRAATDKPADRQPGILLTVKGMPPGARIGVARIDAGTCANARHAQDTVLRIGSLGKSREHPNIPFGIS